MNLKILVRGNPDDWLSYEIFKDNHWEHTTHWADKILVDGLSGFKELNEQEGFGWCGLGSFYKAVDFIHWI